MLTTNAGRLRTLSGLVLITIIAALAACGGGGDGSGSSSGFDPNADIKGQTITVLIPYKVPSSILDEFTKETGVNVTFNTAGWDAIHSKLIVANQAQSNIADVTEFDWSFTGQFASAGWYEPLEDGLDPSVIKDLGNTDKPFMDSAGHLYAACYSNDFRMSIYNKALFREAGISKFPATFKELGDVNQKLKSSGAVQYPMSIAMAATEGGVTPWYLLTLAMGGQLFDEKNQPVFGEPNSPALKALQWEIDAVKNGDVPPGAVTIDDGPAFDAFTAGQAALQVASSPGNLPTANDASQSKIAGDAEGALVPGETGPGASFGLPEGLGIPVTSTHKDAALAFINWWETPDVQTQMYQKAGFLPCGASGIHALTKSGKLQSGAAISAELKRVEPLVPSGAPKWYGEFSSDAQGLINAAIKGDMSASDALNQLSDQTAQLAKSD
jgi:multiple sugar transport system substrate-binding protein